MDDGHRENPRQTPINLHNLLFFQQIVYRIALRSGLE